MLAIERKDVIMYVEKDEVKVVFNKPELSVIVNKGVIVDNSRLPVSCHYCELKWEQMLW